mmetsp:Transcript_77826/g.117083  ORF Transcript_77826/g.117083 Transcript_77826/m.117083 type:complete len:305 (+) Transcript_77826:6439-7353(+)
MRDARPHKGSPDPFKIQDFLDFFHVGVREDEAGHRLLLCERIEAIQSDDCSREGTQELEVLRADLQIELEAIFNHDAVILEEKLRTEVVDLGVRVAQRRARLHDEPADRSHSCSKLPKVVGRGHAKQGLAVQEVALDSLVRTARELRDPLDLMHAERKQDRDPAWRVIENVLHLMLLQIMPVLPPRDKRVPVQLLTADGFVLCNLLHVQHGIAVPWVDIGGRSNASHSSCRGGIELSSKELARTVPHMRVVQHDEVLCQRSAQGHCWTLSLVAAVPLRFLGLAEEETDVRLDPVNLAKKTDLRL